MFVGDCDALFDLLWLCSECALQTNEQNGFWCCSRPTVQSLNDPFAENVFQHPHGCVISCLTLLIATAKHGIIYMVKVA